MSTIKLDKKLNKQCLKAHNALRKLHQANDLVYNEQLAKESQKWAEWMAENERFEHSPDYVIPVGENIAMTINKSAKFKYKGQSAVNQWYSEINDYDYNKDVQLDCGHFSQVVWKETKEAGFGRASNAKGKHYIVGRYLPAANAIGKWRDNVSKPTGTFTRVPRGPKVAGASSSSSSEDESKKGPTPRQSHSSTGSVSEPGSLIAVIGPKDPADQLVGAGSKTKTTGGKKVKFIYEHYQRPDGTKYTLEEQSKDAAKSLEKQTMFSNKEGVEMRNGARESQLHSELPLQKRSLIRTAEEKQQLELFRNEVLNTHTTLRRMHNAEELFLNQTLCDIAQEWAEFLLKEDLFEHSSYTYDNLPLGENITLRCISDPTLKLKGENVVEQWYAQSEKYNYGNESANVDTGHFTQVIWKDSKLIGVGMCSDGAGKHIAVCNYFPAGNIVGEFTNNVFPVQ